MPWLETAPMEQRERFIDDSRLGLYDMTELCARYAVSRKTGYKWLARYDAGGAPHDRSRYCTRLGGRGALARRQHFDGGRETDGSSSRHADRAAVSTTGDPGATRSGRGRRRHASPRRRPPVTAPPTTLGGRLWLAPETLPPARPTSTPLAVLTAATACSRRRARACGPSSIASFREYGLPRAIRTDNGVPFASTALHGLTPLNVWWLRLGIQHQRILPAHPQQNGAHERMHKTLKRGAIRPPRANLGPAARLPPVSPGVQPRAAPSVSPRADARRALSALDPRTWACCPRSNIPATSS